MYLGVYASTQVCSLYSCMAAENICIMFRAERATRSRLFHSPPCLQLCVY